LDDKESRAIPLEKAIPFLARDKLTRREAA
jgi:hypothetical protein